MTFGKILRYGVYNSKKVYKNKEFSILRKVDVFEFDYVLSCDSDAVSYVNDKSCKLVPHMLIIRKPGQTSYTRLHFQCYGLHVQIEEDSSIYRDLMSAPSFLTFINGDTYQKIFEELFQNLVKGDQLTDEYLIPAKLLELFFHINKDKKFAQDQPQSASKRWGGTINKAISFMEQNYASNLKLEDLGRLAGYTPNHFQHLFVNNVGFSPTKYLEKIRVDRAKCLLMKNEKALTDIAYECGFSSYSYFSKVFKRYTLLSPYEYRMSALFKPEKSEISKDG